MKKLLLALTLLIAFVSCKKQEADPIEEDQENKARLSSIKITSDLYGTVLSTKSCDLIYDETGKNIGKIVLKFEKFTSSGEPEGSQEASIVLEYNKNKFLSGATVSPHGAGSFIPAGKYAFSYKGNKVVSLHNNNELIAYAYDNKGNITKTKTGTTETTYAYLNNVLLNSKFSTGSTYNFEFGTIKNPLAEIDKGVAHLLINYYYGGVSFAPLCIQSQYLASYKHTSGPPSKYPPVITTYTVLESKENYPLKVEVEIHNSVASYFIPKAILEYGYTDL